jgi:hypothetical protein
MLRFLVITVHMSSENLCTREAYIRFTDYVETFIQLMWYKIQYVSDRHIPHFIVNTYLRQVLCKKHVYAHTTQLCMIFEVLEWNTIFT